MTEGKSFSTMSSTTVNQDTSLQLLPLPALIPTMVLVPLVVLVAVVGNLLVIASYCTDPRLRTVSNLYLLHLSICDLFLALVSMPVYLVSTCLRDSWVLGRAFCKVFLVNDYTLCAMSAYLVILISLDQLLILRDGIHYTTKQTKSKAYVKISIAWIFSFLIYSPAIIGWEYWMGYSRIDPDDCDVEFVNNKPYTFVTMVLEFFFPSIALTVLNSAVYWEIRKRTKISITGTNFSTATKSNKSTACDNKKREQVFACTPGNTVNTANSSVFPNAVTPVSLISSLSRHSRKGDVNKANGNDEEEPARSLCTSLRPDPPGLDTAPETSVEGMNNINVAAIIKKDTDYNYMSITAQGITDDKNVKVNVLNEAVDKNPPKDFSKTNVKVIASKTIRRQSSSQTTCFHRPFSCFRSKPEHQKKETVTTPSYANGIRKDLKAARALFIFVFAFLVMWAPYTIATTVIAFCKSCVNLDVYEFFIWWLWIKSAVNPFLYANNNSRFKMNFFKILGKVCSCCPIRWIAWTSSVKGH